MNKSIFGEVRTIFYFAIPLILNLLAYMGMQLVDVVMLGRLGPVALASSAAGNVMYIIPMVFGIGILTAVGTLSAEAFGNNKEERVSVIVRQGSWLSLLLTIPTILWIGYAPKFLFLIKEPAPIVQGASQLLHGLIIGYLPCLLFVTCREFLTAICKPRIIILITITGIPLNAFLNYIFIYGKLGLPKLGIFGVGLATSLVEWSMLCAIVIFILRQPEIRRYQPFKIGQLDRKNLKKIVRLGLPVGISFVVEELLFVVTTLLMGYFGVNAMAAHQIALQCVYFVSMISIGIAQATAICVSHSLGSNALKSQQTAKVAVGVGMMLAIFIAFIFWFAPNFIISLFINVKVSANQPVEILASSLIVIAAIFHIIDAIQIITNGALRGYQDTLVPMFLGLLSFWIVGIGSGYIFGFIWGYGAQGLWWGLALGIAISAILLQWRLRRRCMKKGL